MINYIFAFLPIVIKFLPEKIGEKEKPEYCEHYKQLDNNYYPDFSAPSRQIPETFIIKGEEPGKYGGSILHSSIT
jgi:hypothetical protein